MNCLSGAALPSLGHRRGRSSSAGRVLHGTERLDKPGKDYPEEIVLTLEQPPRFVSRGGEKLDGFLRQFNVDLRNAHVLDVGASTEALRIAHFRQEPPM